MTKNQKPGKGNKSGEKPPLKNSDDELSSGRQPRFHLDAYRKFIREATPYVSLIAGRRMKANEAESMSNQELTKLALLIDDRVADLNASKK